jgi:hypothetical protein
VMAVIDGCLTAETFSRSFIKKDVGRKKVI